jgi:hypothetical protein
VGFEQLGSTPPRAGAGREQDFDVCLIKLADAYVRFAIKHSAPTGLMYVGKHKAAAPLEHLLPSQINKPMAENLCFASISSHFV